jgi:hypothetical protein
MQTQAIGLTAGLRDSGFRSGLTGSHPTPAQNPMSTPRCQAWAALSHHSRFRLISNYEPSNHIKKPKLLLCLALVCFAGCAERFSQGNGDAGQFMLQHVVAYGGAKWVTNDLPVLQGNWQFRQDKSGVVVRLPVVNYDAVRKFVSSAFGVGSLTGESCPPILDFGVLITVKRRDENVIINIYRPIPYSKQKNIITSLPPDTALEPTK